jgi:hypothetical protein
MPVSLGGRGDLVIAEQQLLNAWRTGKEGGHFYRLEADIEVDFEYRGPQVGHPSNYAAIKLTAMPSAELVLESCAVLPASVTETYTQQLVVAVGRAVVDDLFAAGWEPYRGCRLRVDEIGWDEIMSSEIAVYRAARGVLAKLRQAGRWKLVT